MDNIVFIIIFLILASGLGYAVMFIAFKKGSAKREALEELATQNGWSYQYTPPSRDDGSRQIIKSTDDAWTVTICSNVSAGSPSAARWTEWHTNQGALTDGAAVLGPALPEKTVKMLNGPASGMFADVIKRLMFQFTKGMDVTLDEMAMVESTAGLSTGTVLATKGQETAVEIFRESAALAKSRAGKNEMEQPIVFRDQNGMRVRTRTNPKDAAELADFINASKEISTRLSLLD